jgi:hypothetical protein
MTQETLSIRLKNKKSTAEIRDLKSKAMKSSPTPIHGIFENKMIIKTIHIYSHWNSTVAGERQLSRPTSFCLSYFH